MFWKKIILETAIGGDYECSSPQHRGFWYLLIGFDTSPNVSWKDRHSNHRHQTGDFWYSSNSVNPNNGKLDIQVWSIPNCQFIAQISSSYWVPAFLSVFASHQSRVSHFRSEEEFTLFLNSDFTLSCGFLQSESQGAPDEAHSCAAWTSDVSEPTTWGVSCTSTQTLTRNTWTHALCTRETAGSVTELRRGPAVGKNDEAIGNCILSILSYSHHLISNSLSVWSISEKNSPNGDQNPLEGIKTPLVSSRNSRHHGQSRYCGHRLYLNGALSMSCTSQLATTWRCSLDSLVWFGVLLAAPKKNPGWVCQDLRSIGHWRWSACSELTLNCKDPIQSNSSEPAWTESGRGCRTAAWAFQCVYHDVCNL